MTVIESVRIFLNTCPLLDGDRLNVDFLPPDGATYSVDVVATKPVVKFYLDGSTQRQFLFALATRAYYGTVIRQQIDNLGFFEDFTAWLEAQHRNRNFPNLGDGKTGQKLEVVTSGYIFDPQTDTARYQIQCRLIYVQKGLR